jgi:hypothetical protein
MQIVFAANHNFIGWLIKFFTKISWVGECRVIHVIIRYGGKESSWILEANEKGFLPNWWDYFKKKEKIFAQYEVLGIDEVLLEKIVDEQVDKFVHDGYDFIGVLGLAWSVIWYEFTGKRIKNIFSKSNHFSCSEIIYRIFDEVKKQTGIDYFGDYDAESVFPEELLRECEKKPDLFKLAES